MTPTELAAYIVGQSIEATSRDGLTHEGTERAGVVGWANYHTMGREALRQSPGRLL